MARLAFFMVLPMRNVVYLAWSDAGQTGVAAIA
jgi:hypothetical protein